MAGMNLHADLETRLAAVERQLAQQRQQLRMICAAASIAADAADLDLDGWHVRFDRQSWCVECCVPVEDPVAHRRFHDEQDDR